MDIRKKQEFVNRLKLALPIIKEQHKGNKIKDNNEIKRKIKSTSSYHGNSNNVLLKRGGISNLGRSFDSTMIYFTNIQPSSGYASNNQANVLKGAKCNDSSYINGWDMNASRGSFPLSNMEPGTEDYFCTGLSTTQITIPGTSVIGLITGWTDPSDISKGVNALAYTRDFTANDMRNILNCSDGHMGQPGNCNWLLADDQLNLLFESYCFIFGPSGDTNGTCPFQRGLTTPQDWCPNILKTNENVSGSTICESFFGSTQARKAYADPQKQQYCQTNLDFSGNPNAFLPQCDCLGSNVPGAYTYLQRQEIENIASTAGINLEGPGCWFPPCKDQSKLLTSDAIPPITCTMPDCENAIINNNNRKTIEVICQVCCTSDQGHQQNPNNSTKCQKARCGEVSFIDYEILLITGIIFLILSIFLFK